MSSADGKILHIDLDQVQRVRAYAEAHVTSYDELLYMMKNPDKIVQMGSRKEHVVESGPYKMVFSLEQQAQCVCKHFSMSVTVPMPSDNENNKVASLLSMETALRAATVFGINVSNPRLFVQHVTNQTPPYAEIIEPLI